MASMHDLTGARLEKLCRLYRKDPVAYASDMLHVRWWSKQIEVAEAIVKYPRVMAKASHGVGKTHLAGGMINWFYDCFDPGIALTTSPTKQQLVETLWKETRSQRAGRPGLQPKAPSMSSSERHFAVGITATNSDAFQGRHDANVLVWMDESCGIHSQFFTAAEGILTGGEGNKWVQTLNPTDTSSQAYIEDQSGTHHVITINALDHPNLLAELSGKPAPFPGAVTLDWVYKRLARWCTEISASDAKVTDVNFPPGSDRWFRPGPLFEGRVLGRWPSTSSTSIWSEGLWLGCLTWMPVPAAPLSIGCDVARFGDDYTSIFVRRGPCVLHHETHNGWSTAQVAGLLKSLAARFADKGEDPRNVVIRIDDGGVGGGVVDQAGGFTFFGVNSASRAADPEDYSRKRDELWFSTAERAEHGGLDLSRLSEESRALLRMQLMAPTWSMNGAGQRVVEPKDKTKKRIGRSPDDADALNLAFSGEGQYDQMVVISAEEDDDDYGSESAREMDSW